jgi:PIN domain nuclease of toxin-antitoxin system
MDLLLDTCAFIWWDSGGGLSEKTTAVLTDPGNQLYLSHASLWEMQLKHDKGKLDLRQPLPEIIRDQCQRNGLSLLAIEPDDTFALGRLPSHHADPFDRLIIAQAIRRRMIVVTDDRTFPSYGVPVHW